MPALKEKGFKGKICTLDFEEWANSEYIEPYKITEAEKGALKLFRKEGYFYILKEGMTLKLSTSGQIWINYGPYTYSFLFFEKDKPHKISDILENCEVIDDTK